jgi:dipeptidyl aminopeptidase/acylaminoacyl peptidase
MRPFNASASKPVPRFGWWESSVTPGRAAAGTLGFAELQVDGERAYWLEQRAEEGGRRALVAWTPGAPPRDLLPATTDVGSKVHEYGGGGYTAAAGIIVFSERSDGSVWCVEQGGAPRALVAVAGCRYAAFAIDAPRRRVYAVREDHRGRPPHDPANAIVAFELDPRDAATNAGAVLFGASDFVLAPQLSPDGTRLAFIAWNHPQMPWDGTTLNVVPLDDAGHAHDAQVVAGGADDAIVEAAWSPAGALLFASDRTNWWNLYAWRNGTITALAPVDAEIGFPPWVFGRRAFIALGDARAICAIVRDGVITSAMIAEGRIEALPFGDVYASPVPFADGAIFIATPRDRPAAMCYAPSRAGQTVERLRAASDVAPDPGDVSIGESLTITTDDGETTYATFFPPRNAQVDDAPGELPPLIVMSHGGPTAMHDVSYNVAIAFWTTRGFAVTQVNYRGSTGFGRAYRHRLHGMWGVLDVIDCISTARHLADTGRIDPARVVIRGASASGMTALLALATSDVFVAAATRYGVMDLMTLAADDTHKFELRYLDSLIGPLPAAAERYRERSPIQQVATIDAPVLILQGLDDRVVPPIQATSMRDALRARGVPVVYEAFAGEGHGFRTAATIMRAYELELAFYRDVLARP